MGEFAQHVRHIGPQEHTVAGRRYLCRLVVQGDTDSFLATTIGDHRLFRIKLDSQEAIPILVASELPGVEHTNWWLDALQLVQIVAEARLWGGGLEVVEYADYVVRLYTLAGLINPNTITEQLSCLAVDLPDTRNLGQRLIRYRDEAPDASRLQQVWVEAITAMTNHALSQITSG